MKRKINYFILISLIIYILLSIHALAIIYTWISERNYNEMGKSAMNLAVVIANSFEITNDEVSELENLEFKDLSKNRLNIKLENLLNGIEDSKEIKYVYLLKKVDSSKVKYSVDKSDSDFYNKKIGTKLNFCWLLDIVVDKTERIHNQEDVNYYKDKNRYTSINGKDLDLYNEKKAGYFANSDEWGNQISGMAPIYTKGGKYIGLLGVDVYTESLHMYKKNVLALLCMLLLIPTVILISLFINYHNRYKNEMKTTLYKDKLTGLFNRYYYESYISKIVKKLRKTNGNLSVIMLDIDDFKMYNDYYGHVNGDDVLKFVAKEFSEEIEKFRGCSGRYGGEEMIGFLPNITISEGELICDRICNRIKEYRILHENKESEKIVTVSLGISTGRVRDTEWGINDLIKKADAALYKAKKAGKNCYKRVID